MTYYKNIAEMRKIVRGIINKNKLIDDKILISAIADKYGFTIPTKKFIDELIYFGEIERTETGMLRKVQILPEPIESIIEEVKNEETDTDQC